MFQGHFLDLNVMITLFAILAGAHRIHHTSSTASSGRGPTKPMAQQHAGMDSTGGTSPRNWPGPLPTVYRWPYDYSKPGKLEDYVPQTVPLEEGEEDH